MSLRVVEVRGSDDLGRFLALTDRVYRDDPHHVPPLRWSLRRKLARRGGREDADLQLLLAERGGEAVGRVSVLRDRRHEQTTGERVGFFGFFECVDDLDVARALLDAAADRARAFGAERLRGTRNLSRVEEVGVLVEGYDSPPPMMAGHGAAWYPRLVEGCGFVRRNDVLAYQTPLVHPDGGLRALPEGLSRRAEAVDIPGLVVRDGHRLRTGPDLVLAHRIFVEAFRDVPENTPMPLRQFVAIGRVLLAITDRRMLQLATVRGEPAGFALCFPDLNEVTVRARGRLLPAGWLRMANALRRVRTASFKLIGVMPEYRGSGLHAALVARVIHGVQAAGFQRLEASLVDERNTPSRRLIEGAGMEVYKRYRVYERPLLGDRAP